MIEGGHFNVNIRNITEPSSEFHERTIDTWVVLAGSGTAITGYGTATGDAHVEPARGAARTPNTGVEVPVKVGDVMFVPVEHDPRLQQGRWPRGVAQHPLGFELLELERIHHGWNDQNEQNAGTDARPGCRRGARRGNPHRWWLLG